MKEVQKNLRDMLENSLRKKIMDDNIKKEDLPAVKKEIRTSLINLISMDGNAIGNMRIKLLLDKDIVRIFDKIQSEINNKKSDR